MSKLLREAGGHLVILETNSGDEYRGQLIQAEVNMSCYINMCVAYWDGRVSHFQNVYIRVSNIRFVVLPTVTLIIMRIYSKSAILRALAASRGRGGHRCEGQRGGWQDGSGPSQC